MRRRPTDRFGKEHVRYVFLQALTKRLKIPIGTRSRHLKNIKHNGKTILIYKTLQRKLKLQQHEPNKELEVTSCAPEGWLVPAPVFKY